MVAFTDSQLRVVWAAANGLPIEKRGKMMMLGNVLSVFDVKKNCRDDQYDQ